jgi:integrase
VKQVRLPRYVSTFRDRGGIVRYRFRCARKGIDTYMRAQPFTPEWEAEYRALLAGTVAPMRDIGAGRAVPGTIADLVARYRASDEWPRKGAATRKAWESSLGKLTANLGDNSVAAFTSEQAGRILAKMHDRPFAADNFRKRMKALWAWGVRQRLTKMNPWTETRPYLRKTEGFRPWSEAEVATFIGRYPPGTREHLALALMLATFARKSDAIRLGPQHIRDGRLRFRARKNGEPLDIPVIGELIEALASQLLDGLCFLVTAHGRPFTNAGFGNWFADRCKAAGVPGRSHGLRKLAAMRMAHVGATLPELMAWGGWKTEREPLRYIREAERGRLADNAAAKLSRARASLDNSTSNALQKGKKK